MRLAARLRAILSASEGRAGTGPHDERTTRADATRAGPVAEAAVLIAVTDRPAPGVLLTRRHAGLRRHGGQIAFPGGRVDAEDLDAVGAALREADEEIGLPAAAVEVVGTSDRYRTHSGFDILPVLGVVPPDLPLVPHAIEVEDLFEVPLAFLLDPANHVWRPVAGGLPAHGYHEILWGDRRIWGVTAGILVNLAGRLAPEP